jgi:Fe-S-cluster containining protein
MARHGTKGLSPKERLEAIYAKLPAVACKRLCQAFCGIIPMAGIEARRCADRLGRPLDALPNGTCRALGADGNCLVYPVRPLICRAWGCSVGLECPHGCEPERWLTKREVVQLMAEIAALSEETGFEDGRDMVDVRDGETVAHILAVDAFLRHMRAGQRG